MTDRCVVYRMRAAAIAAQRVDGDLLLNDVPAKMRLLDSAAPLTKDSEGDDLQRYVNQ